MATELTEIGLVLSGGGARCYAQVGALKALEEEGFKVCAISANSSAAIIGALYAACCDAAQLKAILDTIDFSSFLDPDGATGLIGHEGVRQLLEEHTPETFEALVIPLAVPAVDIQRAELLIFKEGPLHLPVCASNAFPGLFTPVKYRGRHLMDGGIINNFPVDIIRTMTSCPVLAVDVRPSPTAPLKLDKETSGTLIGKLTKLFTDGVPTTVDILMQAYTITQSRLIEITCAMHPPNVWLRPELPDDLDIQDFSQSDEAIDIGYRSVKQAVTDGRLQALQQFPDA
jgi:NTE family protein